MRRFLTNFLANLIVLYLAAWVFNIISVNTLGTGVSAALILTLVNMIIRPIIMFLALPINFITLGFFILIINTWMVILTDKLVPALYIPSFWTSFGIAIMISGVSIVMNHIIKKTK
jgi:putative membrane protein